MRHPVLLIFINAMILIVVFMLMTQSLIIIQRIAQADKVTGHVDVQRSGRGEFKALAINDMVKTGDVIRSAANSTAEFKWADGTRWKIMPETEITVKKSTHNTVKRADQSQLKLTAGKVFIRIVKALKPESKFEVETPTAVAAVRGTIFSVEFKDGKSEVAVFKGEVEVYSPGDTNVGETIEPGKAAVTCSAGSLREEDDAAAAAEFAKETSIVLPELEAQIETLPNGSQWVSGKTESGDKITINGAPARVLGNGAFRYRLKLKSPQSSVAVVATDKHGESVTKVLNPAAA